MKNFTRIVTGLMICLNAFMVGCSNDPAEIADTTAPTVSDPALTLTPGADSIEVSWEKATDETSLALKYKVIYSLSDNISTLAEAQENGTTAMDFTEDTTSKLVSALLPSTTYYFNVIVKDEAGNQKLYVSNSATTFTCFKEDTLITMADGSKKRIDQIRVGEKVRSFDKNGDFMISVVEKVIEESTKKLVTIEAGDKKVVGTQTHPFYTGSSERESKEYPKYRNMMDIAIGDTLYIEGEVSIVPIKVTKVKTKKSKAKVYNLQLGKGPANFFANGFAVHNGC